MDELGAVVAQRSPLSLDDTTAVVYPDEPNVLHAFGQDEGMVVGGNETVVVEGVRAAYQHGTFHQLDGDVRLHMDAPREVTPYPKT